MAYMETGIGPVLGDFRFFLPVNLKPTQIDKHRGVRRQALFVLNTTNMNKIFDKMAQIPGLNSCSECLVGFSEDLDPSRCLALGARCLCKEAKV